MNTEAVDKSVREREHKFAAPSGWVQWKGTDVCMDVYCICGHHSHFDAEFLYYLRCPKCSRVFSVNAHIQLVELGKLEAEYMYEYIKDADEGGHK